jgi:hypothetical protein
MAQTFPSNLKDLIASLCIERWKIKLQMTNHAARSLHWLNRVFLDSVMKQYSTHAQELNCSSHASSNAVDSGSKQPKKPKNYEF